MNLKDNENRTVQQILAEFSNEKYVKIKKLIKRYQEGEALPTGRYMKPKRQKLLAVPKRNSKTSPTPTCAMGDLHVPPLQYMQGLMFSVKMKYVHFSSGEAITVCGRLTTKVYIGKLHGVTGTFPLKDTKLYQGKYHCIYFIFYNNNL